MLALDRRSVSAQENATPMAAATPQIGPQADGSTLWKVAVGEMDMANGVEYHAFLPGEITINVGDTIRFVHRAPGEPHIFTLLGEGEEQPEDILFEQFADGSLKLVQNMETFLPSGGTTWSGTGFLHSGFMGLPQIGLPMEIKVTFDTAGEFVPYCILHGDAQGNRMAMRLTVSEA